MMEKMLIMVMLGYDEGNGGGEDDKDNVEPHNHSYSRCVPIMVVMKMIKVVLDVVQGSFMST